MPILQSKSIYHGLPVFPQETKGFTAIVTGANGISGDHMSPDILAKQMRERGISAEYVFFFAYIQPKPKDGGNIWSAAEDLVTINKSLLVNFLEAQALANSLPQRILLQLGAKYYGAHLGPTKLPSEESDPRVYLEPNFYYDQEDYLKDFAAKHGISWNTTRPANIPGAVPDAAMNLCFPLGVYAVVQKHLRQPLEFPSDFAAWTNIQMLSSAQMNCYLAEWAVLTEDAKNESFNATDDYPFAWEMFWPKLAAFYGIQWKGPDDNASRTEYHEFQTPYTPPPRGYGPPATIRFKFTLAEWAKRPEVQNAWKEIVAEHNLRNIALEDVDRVFGFTDFGLSVSYPVVQSMAKAKKLGFFGFVDASETIYRTLEEFVDLHMLPPGPSGVAS
ncbi:hypothetical protein N7509_011743 [Penicillium cosmopolitanum]|uniref:PRISE-like Rossmann-fold domain-containing protein n=1 Tax=Penicillium cosmopolitanum TaxID=1131564 RepID=A0A9W9VF89_9EURO|nr:uncharacterized protein N7509_011743 [Penicillium cosmopolitanum]KAJ5378624.1 hypothetical protein N7509_011743 [Penicillium cosmopolitanum]